VFCGSEQPVRPIPGESGIPRPTCLPSGFGGSPLPLLHRNKFVQPPAQRQRAGAL